MSAETNKTLFRNFLDELFNQGQMDAIDRYCAPDFVEHEELPGVAPGLEGVKQLFAMLRGAFPDLQVRLDQVIAEGDKVVASSTWTGTHRGEFIGIPATGKAVTFGVIDIIRIADGKMVEHWGQSDMLGLLQQLGAVPAPGQ